MNDYINLIQNDKYLSVKTPGQRKFTYDDLIERNNLSLDALDNLDFVDDVIQVNYSAHNDSNDVGYASPEKYGLHHIALIYDTYDQSEQAIDYYMGKKNHKTGDIDYSYRMYDTFLPLTFHINGKQTDYGQLNKNDFEDYIGQVFAENGVIDNLNKSAKKSGRKRKIVFLFPWMSPTPHQFGDIDGQEIHLYEATGREAVARWYCSQVIEKMKQYDFLELWGFYRMREDFIVAEMEVAKSEAKVIHDLGYKYLFIPYYMGQGWDKRKELGIDVTIMQPSYAFRSYLDGGEVNASRIYATNQLAKDNEMGVELEFRGTTRLTSERYITAQYMSGISHNSIVAYFLGEGLDKLQPQTYNAIAEYIQGNKIKSPDRVLKTQTEDSLTFKANSVDLSNSRAIRIELLETQYDYWTGQVDLIANGEKLGWLTIGTIDSLQEKVQGYYLPIRSSDLDSADVEIKFTPDIDGKFPNIRLMCLDNSASYYTENELIGSRVELTNQAVDTTYYNDVKYTGTITEGKLNDNKKSTNGWSDGSVIGWNSNPGKTAISVDFGKEVEINRVQVYTNQDTTYGINWPLNPELLITNTPQIAVTSGVGERVVGKSIGLTNKELVIDKSNGAYKNNGHFDKSFPTVKTRYATLLFSTNSWSMLNELTFFNDNEVIPYKYQLLRHTGNQSLYQDNGLRLVDGQYNDGYASGAMTALQNKLINSMAIELPIAKKLNHLEIYAVNDFNFMIRTPKSLAIKAYVDMGEYYDLDTPSLSVFGRKGVKLSSNLPQGKNIKKIVITDEGDGWWHSFTEVKAV